MTHAPTILIKESAKAAVSPCSKIIIAEQSDINAAAEIEDIFLALSDKIRRREAMNAVVAAGDFYGAKKEGRLFTAEDVTRHIAFRTARAMIEASVGDYLNAIEHKPEINRALGKAAELIDPICPEKVMQQARDCLLAYTMDSPDLIAQMGNERWNDLVITAAAKKLGPVTKGYEPISR